MSTSDFHESRRRFVIKSSQPRYVKEKRILGIDYSKLMPSSQSQNLMRTSGGIGGFQATMSSLNSTPRNSIIANRTAQSFRRMSSTSSSMFQGDNSSAIMPKSALKKFNSDGSEMDFEQFKKYQNEFKQFQKKKQMAEYISSNSHKRIPTQFGQETPANIDMNNNGISNDEIEPANHVKSLSRGGIISKSVVKLRGGENKSAMTKTQQLRFEALPQRERLNSQQHHPGGQGEKQNRYEYFENEENSQHGFDSRGVPVEENEYYEHTIKEEDDDIRGNYDEQQQQHDDHCEGEGECAAAAAQMQRDSSANNQFNQTQYSKMAETYFGNNADYFKHLQGDCLCGRCTCGKCKCQISKSSASFDPTKKSTSMMKSLYQHDFKQQHRNLGSVPAINMRFHTQPVVNLPIVQFASVTKSDFKKHLVEEPHYAKALLAKQVSAPFLASSSYKSAFVDWKQERNEKNSAVKAPQDITIVADMPFIGRTLYAENFYKKPIGDRSFEEYIKTKNKSVFPSPMNPDFRYNPESTTAQHFKQYPQQKKLSMIKPYEEEKKITPSAPDQYKSSFHREYDDKSEINCPSRKQIMETNKQTKIRLADAMQAAAATSQQGSSSQYFGSAK